MRQPTRSLADPRPHRAPQRAGSRGRLLTGAAGGVRGAGLVLGLLATATAGLTACGDNSSNSSPGTSSASAPESSAMTTSGTPSATTTSASPSASRTTAVPPPAKTGTTEPASCVSKAAAGMSRAQQVGQLFMSAVGSSHMTGAQSAAITGGRVGSVFLMGHTSAGVATVRQVTDQVRKLAPSVKGATVRMLVSTDQEGGQVQVLNGPGFSAIPTAVQQGKLSASTLQKDAKTWGQQLKAAGVTMNLAPVADTVPPNLVGVNAPIGKLQREYGTNPTTVATHSTAFVRGMLQAGVITSAKHFPGLGRVTGNTDFTAGVTDSTTTRTDPFLEPFRSAVKAGTPFVMVSSAIYSRIDPNTQAAFSSKVMRDLLRGSLGFKGAIISDDLGAAAAVSDHTPAQRAVDFFKAGGNVLLTVKPSDIVPMTAAVISRMPQDAALRGAVSDSLRRVLTAKQNAGLLTC
ncbi:glycoside hydrolase family 3 N-terminal domain-containing protein [Actinacidiphila paucisporea]|uniref:beta-N-acetylhexosaminidase n=1 Tax=Actinacidiphila paucisporea TaxID=310782 RepID=A0A1M7AEC5_9ACTN|nr:glycoside hydrolase family 3 N-terminal domain-containing protein [Actinacidiphila paucisporea]SHL40956.1 beta-N-acetylhexosaminidase [Actinacidiphila paucisporea]